MFNREFLFNVVADQIRTRQYTQSYYTCPLLDHMVFNSVTIVEDLAEHIDEEHTMI